jgi:hypothetical protein
LQRPPQFASMATFTDAEAEMFFKAAAEENFNSDPGVHYDPTEYGLDKWQHAGVRPDYRTSLILHPPDGRLPALTAEAQARPRRPRMETVLSRNPYERCATGYWGTGLLLKGGGGAAGADLGTGADAEHQILQTRDHVVIVAQSNNDVRIIPLDGRPHLSSRMVRWFGDARGRWEGDTLVVETTNFNDVVRFRGQPVTHLTLTERFRRVDAETLSYKVTVDDATTWTRPWTAEVLWGKAPEPMFEFACHETNYGLYNVLRGELAAISRGMKPVELRGNRGRGGD